MNSFPKIGSKLVVTQVGPECPLEVGETVTVGQPSMVSLLGGELMGITVERSTGEKVQIERGPGGAIFA